MAALTLNLVRDCLNNVEDNAGRWQIEGGKVFEGKRHVANYSSVKRVSCGTQEQNTAMNSRGARRMRSRYTGEDCVRLRRSTIL